MAVKTAVQIVKPTYAYGWDKELRQAWRAAFDKNGKLQQKKEFVEVTPLPQSKGTDAPVAVFSDGDTHTHTHKTHTHTHTHTHDGWMSLPSNA